MKRIRCRDAAPCGTVENSIVGGLNQLYLRPVTVFGEGKFNRELPFLYPGRFRHKAVPVLPHFIQNACKVRTEIDAFGIAQKFQPAYPPPVRTGSEAELITSGSWGARGCRVTGCLLNRGPGRGGSRYMPALLAERIVEKCCEA